MFDCYRQDVNDAYQKLLDNEGYFSGIADEIWIDENRIAFKFPGYTYHLSPHSINCNPISDVKEVLLRIAMDIGDGKLKKSANRRMNDE